MSQEVFSGEHSRNYIKKKKKTYCLLPNWKIDKLMVDLLIELIQAAELHLDIFPCGMWS